MAYGGLQWLKRNLPLGSVTYAEIQDVAANKVLGRTTGTGTVEEITCTSFARSILDDADAATVRATIGAGTGSGSGDVTGPSSAVDNCVARFDGTTGKLIQSSGVSIDDSGNITANNLSGTNTGDQATVSGNAGTATKLATARAINGVSFDGSADITVTAAASTLTGTTLASGVTASSLTSFGASPALGTPASGVLTNCTGLPTSGLLNGAVTLAKQANMATSSVVYRKTAGSGAPEVQTLATLKTDLGLTGTNSGDQTITLTGDVTGSGTGSFAATVANNAITLAKMATIADGTVLGNFSGGTAVPSALSTTGSGNVVRATSPTLVTPTLGVASATSINVSDGAVNHIYGATYTASLTNATNVSSSSLVRSRYMRINNIVVVGFAVTVTPTSGSAATVLGISLPVASDFTNGGDANGAANALVSTTLVGATCLASVASDYITLSFTSANTSAHTFYGTAVYTVQ